MATEKFKNLVKNKIVDIEALEAALTKTFGGRAFDIYEISYLRSRVDEFILHEVEMPAYEQVDVVHRQNNIFELIDNVGAFRNAVSDWIDDLLTNLTCPICKQDIKEKNNEG